MEPAIRPCRVIADATAHDSIVRFLCARSRLSVTGSGFFVAENCGKVLVVTNGAARLDHSRNGPLLSSMKSKSPHRGRGGQRDRMAILQQLTTWQRSIRVGSPNSWLRRTRF